MSSAAERKIASVVQRSFEGLARSLALSDERLRKIHEEMARDVRASISPKTSPARVEAIVKKRVRAYEAERMKAIETAVRDGARNGTGLTIKAVEAIFGPRDAAKVLRPKVELDKHASIVAARHIAGKASVDSMAMRVRLGTRTDATIRSMAKELEGGLRLGQSARQLSTRMLKATDIEVRIPSYIEKMRALTAKAPPSEVKRVARREIAKLAKLHRDGGAPQDITKATRYFMEQLEKSGGADIDKAVEKWIEQRAANQAMTIARSEAANARRIAHIESTMNEPYVVGYRWTLSGSHGSLCECDVLASQDLYGLGAGGYPADAVPSAPHPNCMCTTTTIIDEHYFKREIAKARGEPEPPKPWESGRRETGAEWIARQPKRMQRAILGPGRLREFQRDPKRVVKVDGTFNPLWKAQGRPRPPALRGERRTWDASSFRVRPQGLPPTTPKGGGGGGGAPPPPTRPSPSPTRAPKEKATPAQPQMFAKPPALDLASQERARTKDRFEVEELSAAERKIIADRWTSYQGKAVDGATMRGEVDRIQRWLNEKTPKMSAGSTRDRVRALMAKEGVISRHDRAGMRSSIDRTQYKRDGVGNARATHSVISGETRLSSSYFAKATTDDEKMVRVRTLVHEELHGAGPSIDYPFSNVPYVSGGKTKRLPMNRARELWSRIEETTTEVSARALLARHSSGKFPLAKALDQVNDLGEIHPYEKALDLRDASDALSWHVHRGGVTFTVPNATGASYNSYVAAHANFMLEAGAKGTPDEILERLAEAALSWKRKSFAHGDIATAARRWIEEMGIDPDAIITTPKGKETPLDIYIRRFGYIERRSEAVVPITAPPAK